VIASLTSSPTTDGTTISAIVTEAPGGAMVAGGTLIDKPTQHTYGAFSTPGGQGTFIYDLPWEAVNMVQPISFPAGSKGTRTVTARFFDSASNVTSQDLTLTVGCPAPTQAGCAGVCIDVLNDDRHCGSCTNDCTALGVTTFATCSNGSCGHIEFNAPVTPTQTCAQVCTGHGLVCDCNPSGSSCALDAPSGVVMGLTSCTQSAGSGTLYTLMACSCRQP
jgi:hypothetical protein